MGGETAQDQKVFNVRLPSDQLQKCCSGLLCNANLQFLSVCDTVNLFCDLCQCEFSFQLRCQ